MLDKIRNSQRWLTAIFIFAIGIVFVFFLGLGGATPGGGPSSNDGEAVVTLDDAQIQLSDYLRVRAQQEQRLRDSIGEQFDAKTVASFLDTQALQAVVNQVVLSQSALDLGLVASAPEVKDLLRNDPNLRDSEGRFDQANFDANVKWTYGSPTAFLNSMQRDLLQQKMFELLVSQSYISDAELRSAAQYKTEEVRIAYVALDAEKLPEARRPGGDAVERYFEANREPLQATYDATSERFNSPEQVRMRHILFKPAPDSGEEGSTSNREQAEQVLARLEAGEDFAGLAEEFSDDPNSNKDGGNLGVIERGDVAPNLEAAVFDLEPGKPSAIVEGVEGLHIAWVDEKIESNTQSFDEAGITLAAEAATREEAKRLAQELAQSVAEGQSLEEAARAAGLTLERTSFFTRRRDGFIPGLSRPSMEVLSMAFALTPEAPSSKQVFEVDGQQILIQLLERQEADPASLEAAITSARETLPARRQNILVQAWIDKRREELESEQRLQINAALIADR